MSIRFHTCIRVRIVIKQFRDFYGTWGCMFHKKDGSLATYEEVMEYFLSELEKGHELIPAGECDNFNYAKGGGCQGHVREEEAKDV